MKFGYRVTEKDEVGRYPADLLQVSAFYGWPRALEKLLETVEACRTNNIRYVVHPVDYRLSDPRPFVRPRIMEDVRIMASHADLALILHDEVDPMGTRLSGAFDAAYRAALIELSALCPISLENATNNNDIKWFWQTYTRPSITLDLGHLEASALDPVGFVERLEDELLQRVEFVHLHRTNGLRRGLRDHWGLTEDCPELEAARRLIARKPNVQIILEVIGSEELEKSLELLGALRTEGPSD